MKWSKRREQHLPSSQQVIASQEANKEMFTKAKEANQQLNNILKENHLTITIHSAMGGKTKRRSA